MPKNPYDLKNIPEEFRSLFININNQIKEFGDGINLVEFSFFIINILYSCDFNDEEKNLQAKLFRELIYDVFHNKEYIDGKIIQLENNDQEILQYFYAQGLVYLWTILESFVKQFVSTLINFDKDVLTNKSLEKIKIPMTQFFQLKEEDKTQYLTELIIKELNCDHKYGIDKFECIFNIFDMNDAFNDKRKQNLFALQQLRNCIVHNDSKADRRFCQNCSWMGYKLGEKVVITKDDLFVYEKSVRIYIGEIYYRLNKKLNAPKEYLKSLREIFDNLIVNKE